jgi:flagellar basal body P-ring formation protein FlgA
VVRRRRRPAASVLSAQVLAGLLAGVAGAAPANDMDWRWELARALQSQPPYQGARVDVLPVALPDCRRPVRLVEHRPVRPGAVQVVLACEQPRWTRQVGVRVSARVRAAVAARPLPRGHVITEADLLVTDTLLAGDGQPLTDDPAALIGRELLRPMAAGAAIALNAARDPSVIRKGQRVTVVLVDSGFEIRSEGVALQDGALGEPVPIRLRDGTVLSATVQGAGSVSVEP